MHRERERETKFGQATVNVAFSSLCEWLSKVSFFISHLIIADGRYSFEWAPVQTPIFLGNEGSESTFERCPLHVSSNPSTTACWPRRKPDAKYKRKTSIFDVYWFLKTGKVALCPYLKEISSSFLR